MRIDPKLLFRKRTIGNARNYATRWGWKKYKCEKCGSTKNLDAHHPYGDYETFTNVITLCRSCHFKQHTVEIKEANKLALSP